MVYHAAPERPGDAHAVFDHYGERLGLIRKIPEQSGIAARGIYAANNPTVPCRTGKTRLVALRRWLLVGGPLMVPNPSRLLNPFSGSLESMTIRPVPPEPKLPSKSPTRAL